MGISTTIADPCNGRANYVYNSKDDGSVLFCCFNGNKCISSFSTLAYCYDDIAFVDDGISVPEFGCVFNFYRDTAKFFNDIFGKQSCVPTCAAGDHDDPVGIFKMFNIILYTTHGNSTCCCIQSSTQAIMNGTRLFKNFFQHKMVVTAFFNGSQFHIQFGNERSYFFVAKIF